MIKEPHDPGRSVAPITVTDCGFKKTSSSDFVGTIFSSLPTSWKLYQNESILSDPLRGLIDAIDHFQVIFGAFRSGSR